MAIFDSISSGLSMVLPIPHILVNVLILFISLKRVRHSILRTFTLNLTIPSLVYSIYSTVATVFYFTGRGEHFGISAQINRTWLDYTTDFVLYFCGYDYHMLAIVLVTITYCLLAKPLFAKKYFKDRTIYILFLLSHLVSLCSTIVSTISQNQSELLVLHNTQDVPFDWLDYFEGLMATVTFVILLILYVVCVNTILNFNRQPKVAAEALKNDKNQGILKRRLLIILLYITPPNIFLLPSSVCTDISTIFMDPQTVVYRQFCYVKAHFQTTLLACRLLIASFTIIIAFSEYREALFGICRRNSEVFKTKTFTAAN